MGCRESSRIWHVVACWSIYGKKILFFFLFVLSVCAEIASLQPVLMHNSFLEELVFWMVKFEFPQKLVCFLLNMLPDINYKVCCPALSVSFVSVKVIEKECRWYGFSHTAVTVSEAAIGASWLGNVLYKTKNVCKMAQHIHLTQSENQQLLLGYILLGVCSIPFWSLPWFCAFMHSCLTFLWLFINDVIAYYRHADGNHYMCSPTK